MDRSLQRLAALSLLCGLTACVRVTPYTADELASATRPAKMLVKYLEQRDADPGVCDMSREGPALSVADASVVSALFKSFEFAVSQAGGADVELNLNVGDVEVFIGLFLGAMLPFLFSSMAMNAVGRAAFEMIEEVRRQFLSDGKIHF